MADRENAAYEAAAVEAAGRRLVNADGLVEGLRSRLEDPVLSGTPMADAHWAVLFAYMHRRFGPPHVPGDDYKVLSAAWLLDTPDPNVFRLFVISR